jgi:tetrahydromethanopterin S-methyltransferase subunit G
MTDFVTQDEFKQLATRVDVIEREVEGEKLVTRHVLEQTRHNGDDLAAIRTRLDRVEGKVDAVAQDVHGLRQDFSGLKGTVQGLTTSLPRIIGDAIRDAIRGRDDKA